MQLQNSKHKNGTKKKPKKKNKLTVEHTYVRMEQLFYQPLL